jgi:hypothetical protein
MNRQLKVTRVRVYALTVTVRLREVRREAPRRLPDEIWPEVNPVEVLHARIRPATVTGLRCSTWLCQ